MNPEKVSYALSVNGSDCHVQDAWYFESLLNVLRDDLALPGTKYACDDGQCGACTVHVDDEAVYSCIELAAEAIGREVTTIEGYCQRAGGVPTQLQTQLIAGGDVQCGYCMPGIVMSASAYLDEVADTPSDVEIREAMIGNLCRCTGYSKIVEAIAQTAKAPK